MLGILTGTEGAACTSWSLQSDSRRSKSGSPRELQSVGIHTRGVVLSLIHSYVLSPYCASHNMPGTRDAERDVLRDTYANGKSSHLERFIKEGVKVQ